MTDRDSTETPGEPVSAKNRALLTAASMVQDLRPVKHICAHLNGFHAYASDLNRCVEADHFCSHVNEDVRQCVIYDGNSPNARLIGVEYMISGKLYATLDEEEKKMWHSHIFEVKSGMVVMPAPNTVPQMLWEKAERAELEQLIQLYGKTYHFWQVDRGDPLPLGPPQLMAAFTDESQVDFDKIVSARDEKFHTDYRHKREIRKDIPEPVLDPNVDAMWKGKSDNMNAKLNKEDGKGQMEARAT
ncbi:MAG: hypothetical protein M1823_006019 [Watsoniomyces obsoletus]|nr:MAG: hypothetical protein M1823_006019 [Watsoniomyces obsoletus]